jgi:hypothetical protein
MHTHRHLTARRYSKYFNHCDLVRTTYGFVNFAYCQEFGFQLSAASRTPLMLPMDRRLACRADSTMLQMTRHTIGRKRQRISGNQITIFEGHLEAEMQASCNLSNPARLAHVVFAAWHLRTPLSRNERVQQRIRRQLASPHTG